MQKTVYILSGPAWVGKTTLWHAVETELSHIEKIVTTTSRPMREGEIHGKDYYFLEKSLFEKKIRHKQFIEYAVVHTNFYGSTHEELQRIIDAEKSPLYIIEPQGMIHLKPLLENEWYSVKTIFILPPSLEILQERLAKRGTETEDQFRIRLATAVSELEQQDFYDTKIINDDFAATTQALIALFS